MTRQRRRGGIRACAVLAVLPALAWAQPREATPESGIGVWYAPGAPALEELWREGDAGERLLIRVRVLDAGNTPLQGARVEMWHADAHGQVHADRFRTALVTGADGRVRVSTVLPGYIWGPRHIHVVVTHPRHPQLVTRLFFKRDPAVKESGRPELAIILEDGKHQGRPALFGDVELVLK